MPFAPMLDAYNDFYVVMESTTPEDAKINILKEVNSNGLNYLRFEAILQAFYDKLNRNRRAWPPAIVRQMGEAEHVQEAMRMGAFVGENGHPVPDNGKVTIERILDVDPNNTSHRIIEMKWKGDKELRGVVETLDEGPGSAGYRMMRNILQGVVPAFSLRALVPQRKNPDGTTDIIGVGRMICYDRVYMPSHKEAYMDVNIPVKNVVTKSKFESVMESFTDYIVERSEKIKNVTDMMEPVMESASYDEKSGLLTMKTGAGRIFVAPETKYRREITDALSFFS